MTTKQTPSCLVATLLFLIFVIPAVIYMIAASKTTNEPFAIHLLPDGTGTRMHGNGQGRGLAAAVWATDQLPK